MALTSTNAQRYDIELDGNGFLLVDGTAESGSQANPYAAKIATGDQTHSDLDIWAIWEQTDWAHGHGESKWVDGAKYRDAVHIDTRIRGQALLGPRKHRSNTGTGLLYAPCPAAESEDDTKPKGVNYFHLGRARPALTSNTANIKELTKLGQQFTPARTLGTTGKLTTRTDATSGTITARRKVFANLTDGTDRLRFCISGTWYTAVVNETIGGTAQATLDFDGCSATLPAVDSYIEAIQCKMAITESGGTYTLTDIAARFKDSEIAVGDPIKITDNSDDTEYTWTVATIASQTTLTLEKDTDTNDDDLATMTVKAYSAGFVVSSISFQGRKIKNPQSSFKVRLMSDNADAPNAILTEDGGATELEVTIDKDDFDKDIRWITATLPGTKKVYYDTQYWFTLEIQNTTVATSDTNTTVSGTTVSTSGTWELAQAKTWMYVKDDTSGAYGKISSVSVSGKSVTVTAWTGTPASGNAFTVYYKCDNRGWYEIAYNRHLNTSSYNPYGDGKAIRSIAHAGTYLTASTKWDMFFRVNDGGQFQGTIQKAIFFKPDLDANGRIYVFTYDTSTSTSHCYYYDPDNKRWIGDGSLSGRVQDAVVFDDKLFVAVGNSYPVVYVDSSYDWNEVPDSIGEVTVANPDGEVRARRLAVHGGRLYRCTGTRSLYYSDDPCSATASTTDPWSSEIKVGAQSSRVVKMVSWDDKLAIGKADGLWVIRGNPGQSDDPELVVPFESVYSNENFQAMGTWHGDLYFNIKHDLFQMDKAGNWVNIGPTTDAGMQQNKRGYPRSILTTPGYLYMAIDAGTTRSSSIQSYNGLGWHEIQEAHKLGDRIRELCYDFEIDTDGRDRFWWSEGGDMCFAIMPEQTDNPFQYTSMEYAPHGQLLTSWFDANKPDLDKEWYQVKVESTNLHRLSEGWQGSVTTGTTGTTLVDSNAYKDFTEFITDGDFIVDASGNYYGVQTVTNATTLVLDEDPGSNLDPTNSTNSYYEVVSESNADDEKSDEARWIEVEYRIDTTDDDHWTYLGTIDESPIELLSFSKSSFADITLPDVASSGKAHRRGWVWLSSADAQTLTELEDWVYINGDYAQVVDISDEEPNNNLGYVKVKFNKRLSARPEAGDTLEAGLPWGKRLQLRFHLFTQKKNQTPKLQAFAVKYLANVRDKKLWKFTIHNSDKVKLRDDSYVTNVMQTQFNNIEDIVEKGRVVLRTRYGRWNVKVTDWTWQAVKLEKRGNEPYAQNQYHYLTCVEV